MTDKTIIVMLSLILILVLGQTGCITASPPPQPAPELATSPAPAAAKPTPFSQDSPASLPVSEKVALFAYKKIDSFYNPKYSSNTQGCTHVSAAFALTEGQNLELAFESDCPISWDNFESLNNPRPEIGVVFAEMRSFTEGDGWVTISSGAKEIKSVSSYDAGRRLDVILCPARIAGCGFDRSGKGLYKLLAINLDPDSSHYLKYTVDLVPLPAPTPVPKPPFVITSMPIGPSTGKINQALTFSTSASTNIAGILECQFDWGDGSYSSWSSSTNASHSWPKAGTYTIRAQVRSAGMISDWSAGKKVTITSPSPPISNAPASLPISSNVNLMPYTQIDKLHIAEYSAITEGCTHASSAVSLTENQVITITIESDCPINWFDSSNSDQKPEICVIFAQMWNSKSICSGAKRVRQVSFFNEGKAAQIVLSPTDTKVSSVYRLIALNHDPDHSHYVRYSITNVTVSPPPDWIPSVPSPITLGRSPSTPEIMKFFITPDHPEVKAAVNEILSGEWRAAYSDFEALRTWVCSHVSYKSDQSVHGVRDYWQLPAETLKLSTGDCEDYAILLCTLLRAYGVPCDEVYVGVGCAEGGGSCHAYLFERYYKGIWRVIEPQATWSLRMLFDFDWAVDIAFDDRYCFNDCDGFKGSPTLPSGVYELEVDYSFWPATRGASAAFEGQLGAGEVVSGSLQWLKAAGGNPRMIYDWSLYIYGPEGDTVYSWSGTDLRHDFSFAPTKAGTHKLEILKRDYVARCARLTMAPPGWRIR